jgi:hypothetical protein
MSDFRSEASSPPFGGAHVGTKDDDGNNYPCGWWSSWLMIDHSARQLAIWSSPNLYSNKSELTFSMVDSMIGSWMHVSRAFWMQVVTIFCGVNTHLECLVIQKSSLFLLDDESG